MHDLRATYLEPRRGRIKLCVGGEYTCITARFRFTESAMGKSHETYECFGKRE